MQKTYSQYIQYIKRMLGVNKSSEDSLEFLNEDLTEYVKIAFSEVLPYINTRNRKTLPWIASSGGAINLKEFKIKAKSVTAVRRGSSQGYLDSGITTYSSTNDGIYPNVPIFSLGYTGGYYAYGYNINADPWITEKLMLKSINETADDGQFIFDYEKQLLFIYFNPQIPTSITIDYIPQYDTIEDIEDDYWTMILQRYALAITKRALSQYRGKYSNVEGAPFTLDYNRLQVEADTELTELKEILTENLLNYRYD